jgi:hypothetical protein
MSVSLDREAVIVGLTDGVGVTFGRAARRSFFDQLKRLEGQQRFQNSTIEEQQSLVDLLAVAAFYQVVVVPIQSSSSFVSIIEKSGATHLRVAGDRLDRKYGTQADAVSREFHQFLRQANIPDYLLTYSSLDRFVRAAQKHFAGSQG